MTNENRNLIQEAEELGIPILGAFHDFEGKGSIGYIAGDGEPYSYRALESRIDFERRKNEGWEGE